MERSTPFTIRQDRIKHITMNKRTRSMLKTSCGSDDKYPDDDADDKDDDNVPTSTKYPETTIKNVHVQQQQQQQPLQHPQPNFRETTPKDAKSLTDGVVCVMRDLQYNTTTATAAAATTETPSQLLEANSTDPNIEHCNNNKQNKEEYKVILPWVGFGTYHIGQLKTKQAVYNALEYGYRNIDTAFIYGRETSELLVGEAINMAIQSKILQSRTDIFVTTKHWRSYHGYDRTMKCLHLSLERLNVSYIDLYLMHWPGVPTTTKGVVNNKNKDNNNYDNNNSNELDEEEEEEQELNKVHIRAETWRAMEDSLRNGLVRSIGVSNMTVQHLQTLKQTATMWPPAVNQVEFHPLLPQSELLEYCRSEGIILQAYASLGGQDMSKKFWKELLGPNHFKDSFMKNQLNSSYPLHDDDGKVTTTTTTTSSSSNSKARSLSNNNDNKQVYNLMNANPVKEMARQISEEYSIVVTPAQVLLRWAIDQGVVIIPKTVSKIRLHENASIFHFQLSTNLINQLQNELLTIVHTQHPTMQTKNLNNDNTTKHDDNNPDSEELRSNKGTDDSVNVENDNTYSKLTRLCWRNEPLRHLNFR